MWAEGFGSGMSHQPERGLSPFLPWDDSVPFSQPGNLLLHREVCTIL